LDLFEGPDGRRAIVAPIGRLDRDGLGRLVRAFEQARNYQAQSVTLELSRVHHLDYRGIDLLMETVESCLAEGCVIRVEGVTKYVREIFRVAGGGGAGSGGSGASAACGTAPRPAEAGPRSASDRAGLGLAAGPGGAE
jgi:ABC-type transporter Mla MlaB component